MSFVTNIQWKGTDLCMDLNCPKCGEHSHFDGMFAYNIRCPHCKTMWKMPQDVPLIEAVGDDLDMPFLASEDEKTAPEGAAR